MEFEKNTLLFGADPTPRIVVVELGETGTVRVHRRETDGSTVTDVEPFHPFVWADSDVVDLGIETEKLRGNLKYGWLITVDSWKELIRFATDSKALTAISSRLPIRFSIISPQLDARCSRIWHLKSSNACNSKCFL